MGFKRGCADIVNPLHKRKRVEIKGGESMFIVFLMVDNANWGVWSSRRGEGRKKNPKKITRVNSLFSGLMRDKKRRKNSRRHFVGRKMEK